MFVEQDPHADAKFWLEVFDAAIKFIALLVGAAWTWMNYVRGRTHKRKLDLGVTAKLFKKGDALYLSSICTVKNIGLSKCEIRKEGTGCEVMGLTLAGQQLISTFETFGDHAWIEPGEQLHHSSLVRIRQEEKLIAIRVSLRVVSGKIRWICRYLLEVPDADQEMQNTTVSTSATKE